MLEPLRAKPRTHEFLVYDLEWWPGTYELRMIGVYDERKGYRFYRTIKEFLRKELSRRNQSRRFYAHFGGTSDVTFLIDYVLRRAPHLQAEACFAGSSAFLLRLSTGWGRGWTFIDSGYLIRRPLAEIGKWIGLEKGPKEAIFSDNFEELVEYNERDCRVLYEAIKKLQTQLNAFGGELKTTLASSALDLFRRRFLSRPIPTHEAINALARKAYIASRVEVFKGQCDLGEYYDINSSFPKSMTAPQPAEVLGISKRLPDPPALYLADLTVEIKACYLPPLPIRKEDGQIVFPTGQWRSTFDSADVELLESSGAGRILKVHDVTLFAPNTDLGGYVEALYALKEKAEGYEREVWKLLLNALYGKFAERSEKRKIAFRPENTTCKIHKSAECGCIQMIAPEIYAIKEEKEVKHAHVPLSVHITSLSRALLFRYLSQCERIYYCDTDSVVCGAQDRLDTGPKLGELKHEYSVRDGRFLAPKLYAFRKPDGKEIVKAKGFSKVPDEADPSGMRSRALTYADFSALADGKELLIRRMQRIRESLNHDATVTPRDQVTRKRVYLERPKRCPLPDGDSRPWTMKEIANA